jgi:ABC-type sugar transport system substrate-binding protein
MMSRRKSASARFAAVAMASALLLAACGDDDDSGAADTAAPTDGTEAPTEATDAPTEATDAPTDGTSAPAGDVPCPDTTDNSAATDGSPDDVVAAGEGAAGPECELPDITVGYLQWIYADEAGKRIEDAARDAVEWTGWGFESCDAGGDPAQMPVCGNQLLDMGVDVIMTDGIPEEFITDVLERAASEGVPVISGGGEVEPRNFYVASFASDDTDMGVLLAEWVAEQLPEGGEMLLQTFPAAWSANRVTGLESVIGDAGIEVVDTWEADPTNLVDGTSADVTTKLQQFPDVDAVWINFSVASIGAAQAIGALPEDEQPLLVTFYANPATIADINAGRVDAAVDEALEWQSWAGVDALMQLVARGQEPSQERAPTYNGVNLSVRQVIDASNAPADGEAVASPVDYEALFKAKWCTEFTNLPSC